MIFKTCAPDASGFTANDINPEDTSKFVIFRFGRLAAVSNTFADDDTMNLSIPSHRSEPYDVRDSGETSMDPSFGIRSYGTPNAAEVPPPVNALLRDIRKIEFMKYDHTLFFAREVRM